MKKLFKRLTFLAVLAVILSSLSAFAAVQEANWTKVKLSKKGTASWNLTFDEKKVKRDIAGYELIVSEQPAGAEGSWRELSPIILTGKTRHEKLDVNTGFTYKFKVRARMNDGSYTSWSKESNAITITEKKANKKKNKQEKKANGNGTGRGKDKGAASQASRGWKYEDGVWSYYDSEGKELSGWLYVNGRWYYLDESGAMSTGTVIIDGVEHSFGADGAKTDQKEVSEPEIEDTEIVSTTIETEAVAEVTETEAAAAGAETNAAEGETSGF